ncbi:hypothetical protein [Mycoplana ramosa]|uniref:DUF2946 domain-containing protein n=1 Tax=Mycoplana ramosa TaxID=40837 RepID=A0ABW3YY41_MYCRA
MISRKCFVTLLRLVLAVLIAGLLLNAPAQAMPADCHTADVAVQGLLASPQQASVDGDHHHGKTVKDTLCCAKSCAICGAAIPSPASSAWSNEITPSYFPTALVGLSGQDAAAVFEPPRSNLS